MFISFHSKHEFIIPVLFSISGVPCFLGKTFKLDENRGASLARYQREIWDVSRLTEVIGGKAGKIKGSRPSTLKRFFMKTRIISLPSVSNMIFDGERLVKDNRLLNL